MLCQDFYTLPCLVILVVITILVGSPSHFMSLTYLRACHVASLFVLKQAICIIIEAVLVQASNIAVLVLRW